MADPSESSQIRRSRRSEEEALLRQREAQADNDENADPTLSRTKSARDALRRERTQAQAEPSVPRLKLPKKKHDKGDDTGGDEDQGEGKKKKKSHRRKSKAIDGADDEANKAETATAASEGQGTSSTSGPSTFILDEFQRKILIVADSEADQRISLQNPYYVIPDWVKLWAGLKHFVIYDKTTTPSAIESVRRTLAEQRALAEELKMKVLSGTDGGFLGIGAIDVEKPAEFCDTKKDPFWVMAGAAVRECTELCEIIHKRQEALEKFVTSHGYHPLGLEDISGLDGAQTYELPPGVQALRKTQLQQCIMQDVVGPKKPSTLSTSIEETTHTEDYVNGAYGRMPVLHADFVIGDVNVSRVDMSLLKQLDTGSHEEENQKNFQRIITLTITFVRFQEHEIATPEHTQVAKLLTAYENYKLLESNLKPGIRSRVFYEKQLESIHHQTKGNGGNASMAAEFARLEQLHKEASLEELKYLQGMIDAWKGIQSLRSAAPPAETKMNFYLRRHGDPTHEPVVPTEEDDLLNFVPVLSGFDPAPVEPRSYRIVAYAASLTGYPQAIGQTDSRALDSTLTLRFNESFELHCTREPNEIFLQLVDDRSIEVARVGIRPRVSQVAMLQEFKTGRALADGREVYGVMSLSTNWTTQTDMTVETIERQFLNGESDPNDPRNAHWVDVMRKYYSELSDDVVNRKQSMAGGRSFNRRASVGDGLGSSMGGNGNQDGIVVTPQYESENFRIQQLRKRWLLKSGDLVPKNNFDLRLITTQIASDSYQVKRDLELVKVTLGVEAENLIQKTEKDITKWQNRIREVKLRRKSSKKEDHELLLKYISQPPVPTLKRFISNIIACFAPRSKLNPSREERPEPDEIDRRALLETKDSTITAHVMKAVGLPTRTNEADGPVEAFVEVSFIDKHSETRTEYGPNPSWFQTLNVDFEPVDFEEETLSLIEDDVIISIYDRVYINELDPKRAQANQTSYRTERRLLGFIKIPFYSIFQSATASVEGLFQVITPRWVMGYDLSMEAPTIHVYVSLWPPLRKKEEKQQTPQDIMLRMSTIMVSNDLNVLHNAALSWQSRCGQLIAGIEAQNPMAKRRDFQAFVTNSRGDPTLICRYILADGITPPEVVKTVADAVRFVSLIPFTVDIVAWDDAKDVWSTNDEYLRMGYGDYEEMALLLIHLIRAVDPGCHCYLVLGEGNVYKQATYVLYWQLGAGEGGQGEWKLIDPRTGNLYSTMQSQTGFNEVTMIVSHNQVWGNVQLSGSPHKMVWDLTMDRYWLPMFDRNMGQYVHNLDYVQKLIVPPWSRPNHARCNELEDNITDKIKNLIREWRGTREVHFVIRHERTLRELLEMMEDERRTKGNVPFNVTLEQQQHWSIEKLRELPQWGVCEKHTTMLQMVKNEGYDAIGVPINVPYRDATLDNLCLLVEDAAVHKIGIGRDIDFSVGVYVHPYTDTPIVKLPTHEGQDPPQGEVISLWAYVVAFVPVERNR